MFNLNRFRLPYRDDTLFSILAFGVFLIPLAFTWYTYEKFEVPKIALLLIFTGWAAIVFALQRKRKLAMSASIEANLEAPKLMYVSRSVIVVMAGLFIWILISAFHSATILNGLFGTYPRFTSGAVFYILVGIFFLLLHFSLNREKFVFLLKILSFDALIISVVGVMQSMGVAYYSGLNAPAFQRAPGLLGNPDFSAMFIAVLLPVVLYFYVTSVGFKLKVYFGVTIFAILSALVLFASRGAWLGAVVGLVLFGIAHLVLRSGKKFVIVAGLSLLIGLSLWYASMQEVRPGAIRQNLAVADSSVSLRLSAWDIAREAMVEHPILGTGPGNFQYFFQNHRGKDLASQAGTFDDVHNLFLQFGATLGIPFLLGFLVIMTLICLSGILQSWKSKDPLPVTIIVSVVSFLLMASFTPVPAACFMVLAVLCAGVVRKKGEGGALVRLSDGGQARSIFRKMAPDPIFLVGLVLVLAGVVFFGSELVFFRGYVRYHLYNYSGAFKLAAFAKAVNPTNQLFSIYAAASEAHLNVDADTVKNNVDAAVALYPNDPRGYLQGANILFLLYDKTGQGEYLQGSIDLVHRAVELDLNNAARYGTLAMFYYAQNSQGNALDYVQYGLSLDNTSVPGWVLLARVLQLKGNIMGSRGALVHAYKLAPDNDLVRAMYMQSQKVLDVDYSKFPIPILYNPEEIE